MPLLLGPALAEALAFGSIRGCAGKARSPQPLPVGARSASSGPGPSTCAAKAGDIRRQSTPTALKSNRTSLSMKELPDACVRPGRATGPAGCSSQDRSTPANLPQASGGSQSTTDQRRERAVRRPLTRASIARPFTGCSAQKSSLTLLFGKSSLTLLLG